MHLEQIKEFVDQCTDATSSEIPDGSNAVYGVSDGAGHVYAQLALDDFWQRRVENRNRNYLGNPFEQLPSQAGRAMARGLVVAYLECIALTEIAGIKSVVQLFPAIRELIYLNYLGSLGISDLDQLTIPEFEKPVQALKDFLTSLAIDIPAIIAVPGDQTQSGVPLVQTHIESLKTAILRYVLSYFRQENRSAFMGAFQTAETGTHVHTIVSLGEAFDAFEAVIRWVTTAENAALVNQAFSELGIGGETDFENAAVIPLEEAQLNWLKRNGVDQFDYFKPIPSNRVVAAREAGASASAASGSGSLNFNNNNNNNNNNANNNNNSKEKLAANIK